MNPLISKSRRPKFELNLRILDLNNVPIKSGTCHVKWHIPSSVSAVHRGTTEKSPIKEHKVTWEYSKAVSVRLTIDKNNKLQECTVHLEIIQEYAIGVRGEKITLGWVELNLAEYVEESEMGSDGEEGVVRRYLMQESKINSTLKVGINMKQLDGEKNFIAPPLKTAAVFGGIAGIMAGEQGEQDDVGHMPTITKSRDHGELQDMYRRALAASWASSPAELPADECIEDIFNGGDGWRDKKQRSQSHLDGEDSFSDEQQRRHHHHHHHTHQRTHSGSSLKSQSTITDKRPIRVGNRVASGGTLRGKAQPPSNDTSSENLSDRGRSGYKKGHEVDEFEVREDLTAWKLPSSVT